MNRDEFKMVGKAGQLFSEVLDLHDKGEIALDPYLHGEVTDIVTQLRSHVQTLADKCQLKETELNGVISRIDSKLQRPTGQQLTLFDRASTETKNLPSRETLRPDGEKTRLEMVVSNQHPEAAEPENSNGVKLGIAPVTEERVQLAILSEAAKGSGRTKIVNFVVSKLGYPKNETERIFDEMLRTAAIIRDGKTFKQNVSGKNCDDTIPAPISNVQESTTDPKEGLAMSADPFDGMMVETV